MMRDIKAIRALQQRFPAGLILPRKRLRRATRTNADNVTKSRQTIGQTTTRLPRAADDENGRFLAHFYPLGCHQHINYNDECNLAPALSMKSSYTGSSPGDWRVSQGQAISPS